MSDDEFNEAEPNMLLFIETLTGSTFEMLVHPSYTVLDIKKKIQRVEGIPVHHQNLLFRLKEVEDFRSLCDIGIVNGSTLKLVLSMRGGPIYTRRLTSYDHHLILKDLKELIEHTREELGDKLSSGTKVSLLVYKEGDVINLIRVIENNDGSYHSYNNKSVSSSSSTQSTSSSSSALVVVQEEGQVGYYRKLQENNAMLAKLTELRKKMSDLSLKRHFKNSKPIETTEAASVGCIGQKTTESLVLSKSKINSECRIRSLRQFRKDAERLLKLHESQFEDELNIKAKDDPILKSHLLQQFRKDAENLLKMHERHFRDEDDEDPTSNEDESNVCEESIALKEKHRGKNSFYNILYQDRNLKLRPDKPFLLPKPRKSGDCLKLTSKTKQLSNKVREKKTEHDRVETSQSSSEEKLTTSSIISPFYHCFNNASRNHKYEAKINLPDITSDLNISPPTSGSSLAESIAILDDDTENEEKELISPIGVPCAGTVSMSKVSTRNSVRLTPLLLQDTSERTKSSPETVNLEEASPEYCDLFPSEATENFRSNKLGLLKRWQSVDCSSEESCNPSSSGTSDFELVDRNCYLPSLYPSTTRKFPAHYAPNLYLGVNEERISRSPLYRRFSQIGNCVAEADGVSKSNDNHTHSRKLNDLNSTWDNYSSCEASTSNNKNSNCDNVLNIQPLPGTLYNIINGRSQNADNRVELNPVRLRSDSESKKLVDEIKNFCTAGDIEGCKSGVGKIQVDTTKIENLPSIINKKRMRCALCNKRLNITNMYDCRCGGIFCAHHRYSEVHGCHYDYKSEGRKLLEQQNPVVIADKLNKL